MLGKPPLTAGTSTTICTRFNSRDAPLCPNFYGNLCPTRAAALQPKPPPAFFRISRNRVQANNLKEFMNLIRQVRRRTEKVVIIQTGLVQISNFSETLIHGSCVVGSREHSCTWDKTKTRHGSVSSLFVRAPATLVRLSRNVVNGCSIDWEILLP